MAYRPRSRVIAFSWGLVSFKNFTYVASISGSFDADLLRGKERDEERRILIT